LSKFNVLFIIRYSPTINYTILIFDYSGVIDIQNGGKHPLNGGKHPLNGGKYPLNGGSYSLNGGRHPLNVGKYLLNKGKHFFKANENVNYFV
jgi:hypothetical protein